MKILYGVQGTGNGHIARSRVLGRALKERGLEVDFLFSGRERDGYFSMECFGNYQVKRGLSFATCRGKVSYLKTLMQMDFGQLHKDIKQLDLSNYDLVITDFEPISAWAAKLQNKTCIGISHQNAFLYDVPTKGVSWIDRKVIKNLAPATHTIGLHWHHFNQPILPPIIDLSSDASTNDESVLVYLPFEDNQDVEELLLRFNQQKFVSYHPDNSEVAVRGNVEHRPLCHDSFKKQLHACSGVIANGGFELPSEALSLGKKLLLKPLKGQFEQLTNVATLETLGLAQGMDFLDAAALRDWLDEQPAEHVHYPNVANSISEWICQRSWESQKKLPFDLWNRVDFPSYTANV